MVVAAINSAVLRRSATGGVKVLDCRAADPFKRVEGIDQLAASRRRQAVLVQPAMGDRRFEQAIIVFDAVELAHEFKDVPGDNVVGHAALS